MEQRASGLVRRTPGATWKAAKKDPGARKLGVRRAPGDPAYAVDEATLRRLRDGLLSSRRPDQPPRIST